ncbi:ABC transporter [Ectothiorhodosinus mongolicus]|uniref:ABC transporter n=1 Tax=Ectothiorhodosinus mongolicus TaxID=233100 RepID=A0A1R3VWH2_9GAMM|nr:ABC transporter [Ectothiorhodosinus mongolicus]SIT69340.1 ABC transporter [Ectothiorhodosinus mongolicus]
MRSSNVSPSPLLQVQQGVFGFSKAVFGPVTLSLQRGDCLSLMSPNGSGKSLLLQTLAGKLSLLQGQLIHAADLKFGFLAQEHARPRPWPLSSEDWLVLMGSDPFSHPLLDRLRGRRLDQLSGGQWQFLRLASVLNLPVPLLLLDEPANHLDTEVRDASIELIQQCSAGKVVLMSTHDADFAAAVGFPITSVSALVDQS